MKSIVQTIRGGMASALWLMGAPFVTTWATFTAQTRESTCALVSAQAAWGVLTLVNGAPLPVALVHQGLGVIVLLTSVWLVWSSRSQTQVNSQMAEA